MKKCPTTNYSIFEGAPQQLPKRISNKQPSNHCKTEPQQSTPSSQGFEGDEFTKYEKKLENDIFHTPVAQNSTFPLNSTTYPQNFYKSSNIRQDYMANSNISKSVTSPRESFYNDVNNLLKGED